MRGSRGRRAVNMDEMTGEQRAREIAETTKLLDEIAAMSHYQIFKLERVRARLADLGRTSQQVEAVESGGEGLTGREFTG